MTRASIVDDGADAAPADELESAQGHAVLGATKDASKTPDGATTAIEEPSNPRRLLILDDDLVVSKVLSRSAGRVGVQAHIASNPKEFFIEVAEWRPTHVAIDLSMPELSGTQVIEKLAQMECAARVIVSSGSDMSLMTEALTRAAELGLGVAGALPKPFSILRLRELLE